MQKNVSHNEKKLSKTNMIIGEGHKAKMLQKVKNMWTKVKVLGRDLKIKGRQSTQLWFGMLEMSLAFSNGQMDLN